MSTILQELLRIAISSGLLLIIAAIFLGFVFPLLGITLIGRPWDIDPEQRKAFSRLNLYMALHVMIDIRRFVILQNYEEASNTIVASTEWFYRQRFVMPPDFVNRWLWLRARVLRLHYLSQQPEAFARQEHQKLKGRVIATLDRGIRALITQFEVQ
jgi:hypothetical protein